jgi:hypothetical protein
MSPLHILSPLVANGHAGLLTPAVRPGRARA